jgi:hypothetical protein
MKFLKYLAAGAILAAGLAQSASAQDHVYITGSTAFRNAAILAINALFDGGVSTSGQGNSSAGQATLITDNTNATSVAAFTNNTTFLWYGGKIGGVAINIAATFTGSATGIYTVAGPVNTTTQIPFLNDTATVANLTAASLTQTGAPSGFQDEASSIQNTSSFLTNQNAQIAFTDVDQATTVYNGRVTLSSGVRTLFSSTLQDNIIGIPTFKWMASFGFPQGTGTGHLSSYSVTSQTLHTLLSVGYMPLSFITGQTADQAKEVDCTGRNPDSGTRIAALADCGYGTTASVVQYQQTALSGYTVTSQTPWPATTGSNYVAGFSVAAGNNGAGSGADLRLYGGFAISPSAAASGKSVTAAYYVFPLGKSDAATAEGYSNGSNGGKSGGPAVELAYNGVNYSDAAVENGQYTYWGYEHLLASSSLSGNQLTLYNDLVNYFTNTANVSAIEGTNAGISIVDPNMLVQRGNTGTTITPVASFPY